MEAKVKRYYQLKQKLKEYEQELVQLRQDIIGACEDEGVSELEVGNYRVRIISQGRKEYDERKLYEALPDPELWRLLSKPDPSKIAGLVKLNVISEEKIVGTYSMKNISLLQIDKR